MRVLHVIPSVGVQRGGPSVAMDLIAASLAALGVQVDVATTDDNDRERQQVPLDQPVARAGATYRFFPRQLRAYGTSLPLSRWVRQHVRDYDLIHTHALFSHAPVSAARAARKAGVPYIVRPLGTLAPYGLKQHPVLKQISLALFERSLLQHASAIHCTSQAEANEIKLLSDDWRLAVIPLGLDVQAPLTRDRTWLREKAPALRDRLILLFLSRIDPKKGLDVVLQALAEARARQLPWALIVAGDGEPAFVRALQTRASELGIEHDVFWSGHLDELEKTRALAAADLFVLPSRGENFGVAAVEALAAGLPVIISSEVGVAADIAAHDAGVVTDGTAAGLLAAVARLQETAAREGLAARGHALARSRYSMQSMANALLQLYRDVVKR